MAKDKAPLPVPYPHPSRPPSAPPGGPSTTQLGSGTNLPNATAPDGPPPGPRPGAPPLAPEDPRVVALQDELKIITGGLAQLVENVHGFTIGATEQISKADGQLDVLRKVVQDLIVRVNARR